MALDGDLTVLVGDCRIRLPTRDDGPALWALVGACGTLSRNSDYFYVLMADLYGDTCAVAERDGRALGLVVGLRPPERPEALFVWQIGVHPDARGRRLGVHMLDAILARPANRTVTELRTTIAPGNAASGAMFRAFAAQHGASMEAVDDYPKALFPDGQEREQWFRIAPLRPASPSTEATSC